MYFMFMIVGQDLPEVLDKKLAPNVLRYNELHLHTSKSILLENTASN